ncbi:MAG: lipopolysaccharide biosynthesis protein [Bacteroidales bacterium]|nr:lipopolysaccharide biosynthesis protein [Bacteroidales bacterium]
MSNIRQKTLNGVVWSGIQRFGTMSITFVSNIVLARLLLPEDFGCIAMLMIFISLANTFIDGGFGSALIQKKNPTNEDYSTIFYWNIFLSFILYIVLYVSAPLIADFYRIPLLSSVLRVQGIVLFFNALSIVQQNQLKKQLQFKKLSIVYIFSAIISLVVALVTAYNGWGIWSLVVQNISISVIHAILFWVVNKWRPLFVFSWKSFKELFSFGGFMLVSSLFSTFSNEMQGLLVGRMFNPAILGFYNQAYRLEGSAATATSSIIDQVTYPVLASLQDDKTQLINALKRFIQIPAYICSLVMMILIVVAEPLIILLYSDKWIDCVPYFQILCIAGLAVCLQGSANNVIAAIGKSKVLLTWTIVKRSMTIILCLIGILVAGMDGLLWSCVLGAWCVYFINAYLVDKHVGYSFWKQIGLIMPSSIIAISIGLVVYYIGTLLSFGMYTTALIQVALCIILYFMISYMFKLQAFEYVYNVVLNKLKKK